jgi:predicted NUDIX family NTP pyrophosphohydrolase
LAKQEFKEETAYEVDGNFIPFFFTNQTTYQKNYDSMAVEGDCDASQIKSNTFTIEWPPRSGKRLNFRRPWASPD